MSTSENAKLSFESGATLVEAAVMTDSGDHKIHTVSGGTVWSKASGQEPSIMPNGMVTGRNVLSTHATKETVTVAGFTAYSKGVLKTVTATTALAVRPGTDVAKIDSITMTDAGAVVVVEGTAASDAVFIATRGGNGGPPEIPADSVEIGQVRMNTTATAVLTAAEIFQVVGTHVERFDYPVWSVNATGDGDNSDSAAEKNAHIEFAAALPAIHTSAAYKLVYIEYYAPTPQEVSRAYDFVPAENSHSVASQQVYNNTVGSVSSSLGQASFTALMTDNVTDSLVANKNDTKVVWFWPDRNKSAYVLTQGKLGIVRKFPAGDQNSATVTVSAEIASAEFSS
jgi:hypothetical protein